ncbi:MULTISPECIES: damage-inducible protein DinB [Bacillus]|uniref:Damage-inducible protein DinB n=1 Tax=Bacillus cereus TaxID=1396 RepID=A0A2C1M7V8_BACCE|nr:MULTISPECIES: damage-inducible protein DinB [Bacillus]PGU05981.1 damage-inducible protein DinB [Bacillus cereus]PGZ73549.1 damage-inducible protein DinB [Bacillus sp. AFS029637]
MNWSVFKDLKFLLRFSLAILLHALGVTFAALSYGTWVVFVMAAMVVTFFMIQRANYLYKSVME